MVRQVSLDKTTKVATVTVTSTHDRTRVVTSLRRRLGHPHNATINVRMEGDHGVSVYTNNPGRLEHLLPANEKELINTIRKHHPHHFRNKGIIDYTICYQYSGN